MTRRILGVLASTALLVGGTASAASAAPSGASDTAGAKNAPVSCTIRSGAPYRSGSQIRALGKVVCTDYVYGIQAKFQLQKRIGGSWINVGVPAQGTLYDVYAVSGTAYAGFSRGAFRLKGTAKVRFYGEGYWRPIAHNGPIRFF